MTEAQIKSVALFFFFTLLDEDLAEKASLLTIEKSHSRFRKKKDQEPDQLPLIIHHMYSAFERIKSEHTLNKASLSLKTKYLLPPGVSFGTWRQFHKEASTEDLVAVVLSCILGWEESAIATGLGTTIGSVRYRIGRGLRQLGHLITLGEIIA